MLAAGLHLLLLFSMEETWPCCLGAGACLLSLSDTWPLRTTTKSASGSKYIGLMFIAFAFLDLALYRVEKLGSMIFKCFFFHQNSAAFPDSIITIVSLQLNFFMLSNFVPT